MGIGVGLILIAFGAILTWAVNAEVSGLDVTAVGVILLVLGILVSLLDLLWWRTWTWYAAGPPWRRTTYVRDAGVPVQTVQPVQPAAPSRRVVVDEEVPPGGPPPGPPPP
jgi:thiol:disulfide interchange protein